MTSKVRLVQAQRFDDRRAYAQSVAEELRRLVAYLGAHGWTITEICVALGISAAALWNYRTGKDEPKAGVLMALRDLANAQRATGT